MGPILQKEIIDKVDLSEFWLRLFKSDGLQHLANSSDTTALIQNHLGMQPPLARRGYATSRKIVGMNKDLWIKDL